MNLHPIIAPALSEAKQAAQERMAAVSPDAKLAEYRFAYVETFLRALDRAGYAVTPKTGREAPDPAKQLRLAARFELRQWLRDRVEDLDVTEDVDLDDQHPVELVDIEDVKELLGDPVEEVNAWEGGERGAMG
jgi:hypothetical protein